MRNSPDIMTMATQAYINAVRYNEINCIEIMPDDFITIPDISLDFAVIEKTSNAAVIPCDMGWQDVGSWNAYTHHKHHEKDQNGNHIIGTAILQNASNCHVESRDKIVGVIGVENLIIINTPDALLVAHSDHAQDVGDITATITKKLLSSR